MTSDIENREAARPTCAVMLVDEAGAIAAFGITDRALSGHAAADMVGRPFDALVPGSLNGGVDGFMHLQHAAREGSPARTVLLRGKCGAPIPADLMADMTTLGGRVFFAAVLAPHEPCAPAAHEAEGASIGVGLGSIAVQTAHAVNNLLWIVSNSLEALANAATSGDRDTLIADALSAIDEAAALLERLSIYADEHPVSARDLDLKAEVDAACALVARGSAAPRTVEIVGSDSTPYVTADPVLLSKALMSLIFLMQDDSAYGADLAIEIGPPRRPTNDTVEPAKARRGRFAAVTICERAKDNSLPEGRQSPIAGNKALRQPRARLSVLSTLAERCGGFVEDGRFSADRPFCTLWLPCGSVAEAAESSKASGTPILKF
jgi:hypothetical protein